jgi:OMF family outer membrane factor
MSGPAAAQPQPQSSGAQAPPPAQAAPAARPAGPPAGQIDQSPAQPLTLTEALELARKNNRDLKAAATRLQVARADVNRAIAALLPRITAQGRYTFNEPEVTVSFPSIPKIDPMNPLAALACFSDNPPPTCPPSTPRPIIPRHQWDATVTATLPLIAPPAYAALHGARIAEDAQRKQLQATEAQLLQSVAGAFFAAAGTDELVAARRHAIDVAQKTLDNARARLEAGVVNRVEVTRAELAVLQAQQRLLEAEDSRGSAYRVLATLVLLRDPFRVVPPGEPAVEARSDGELVEQALRQRPEVPALEAQVRAAKAQALAQGLRWLPTVSAFGNMRFTSAAGFATRTNAEGVEMPRYDFYAAGVQLDWTLFDGFERDAQRKALNAQAEEARLRLQQLRDTIADDVQNARRQALTRQQGLKSAQRQVQLARETLDLVRIQHDAGTATQLDLLTAQDQLMMAEVALAQARFDLSLAGITLRRLIGAPLVDIAR